VSERLIAVTVGISRSTVGEYLRRAAVIGVTWPVPEGMDDGELERRLFTPPTFEEKPARPLPDWTAVHRELKRRGVTLLLLWEEYRAEHADGYGYSRFCDLYRKWSETISPTMRQVHGPGEKLFVDFAGDTVPVFDAATGAERLAHVFVAVLGASNYTFAEALVGRAGRLDRVTCQCPAHDRRRAEGDRLRQSEGRRHRHLPL
jgi:transposase